MRFEQLQHLIETVESGSISEASKNLYISQQGLSDSLRRLENELGFSLLIRNKKGCRLTPAGQEFYPYAQKVAKEYQYMLNYLAVLKSGTVADSETITLFVNPLLASVLTYNLMQDKSLSKIKVAQASISHTIAKVSEGMPSLGVFLLMDSEIETFTNSLPANIQLIKLFEDEILACFSKKSPLSQYDCIDLRNENIFRINFDTSYYEYFSVNEEDPTITSVKSNDLGLHLRLMLENNAVSVTSAKLLRHMYPSTEIVTRPLASPLHTTFYLVYNTATFGGQYANLNPYRLKIERRIIDFMELPR